MSDHHERVSLLSAPSSSASSSSSSSSSSIAPAPIVQESGVPLQYIILDDRFRVSRIHAYPFLLVSLVFIISNYWINSSVDSELLDKMDPSRCRHLYSYIHFHTYTLFIGVIICLLMVVRPIIHKGLPFLFFLLFGLGILAFFFGTALITFYLPCRLLENSTAYWHSLLIAWIHFWPFWFYFLLFYDAIKEWMNKGWREGKQRGFLSKEYERKPFVGQ